jgi:hypothetical protein
MPSRVSDRGCIAPLSIETLNLIIHGRETEEQASPDLRVQGSTWTRPPVSLNFESGTLNFLLASMLIPRSRVTILAGRKVSLVHGVLQILVRFVGPELRHAVEERVESR